MKFTPGGVVADPGEHLVMTGEIRGTVELPDGEEVNVSPAFVVARDELHAAEIAHAIGQYWEQPENVHSSQINVDENGEVTVEPFVYDDSHYKQAVKDAKAAEKES